MQNVDIDYVSLEHTLKCLKLQVMDSLPYIHKYIPRSISNPQQLFYFLRSKTKYQNDPEGEEFIREVKTLMDNNGRGDCDCFTVLTLASCYYLKFLPVYVNLVGKTRRAPTHIYSSVYDRSQGKICAMDLTNPYYCLERPYKYRQQLIFNI